MANVTRADIKERLKKDEFHYLVSGRLKCNPDSRYRMVAELSREEFAKPLLEAGFAQGDKEYLASFLEGLERPIDGESAATP